MYRFSYHRPETLDEAAALFKAKDDPSYLAGGMTLVPTLKQRLAAPSDLIDLSRIEGLRGIRKQGSEIEVGAFATHGEVAASSEVRKAIPALAALAGKIGDPQVRNSGTLGGALANSDPAADYPAAVLGLAATVVTNAREIAADDYFIDLFETALEEGEIITAVKFPVPKRAAYAKFPNPASRYALVGVFIAETKDGVRVAVTGAGACAFRQTEMEAALSKNFSPDAVAKIKVSPEGLSADIHASAEYRAHLIAVMAKRAVTNLTA